MPGYDYNTYTLEISKEVANTFYHALLLGKLKINNHKSLSSNSRSLIEYDKENII